MESCLAVEREQDKVLKKLKTLSGSASDKLQKVIDQVNALKEHLSTGSDVTHVHNSLVSAGHVGY